MSTGDYFDAWITSTGTPAFVPSIFPTVNTNIPTYTNLFFSNYGECHYCEKESSNNMSIMTILICEKCFKKALDSILKPMLNKKIVSILSESADEKDTR